MPRLYVIVREDLPAGLQAAQAVHAAVGFTLEHPRLLAETVILVGVPDELALTLLAALARQRVYARFAVYEPDLGGSLTALALEPAAGHLCSDLPLLLREVPAPVAQ